MFSAEQYRAKASEFHVLLTNAVRSPQEISELRNLEQTYTTLAENEEWMASNIDKTVQRRKDHADRAVLAEEKDQVLKSLGAALIMGWNTIPMKTQRDLFELACTIGDLQKANHLRGLIARFLHDHKDDKKEARHASGQYSDDATSAGA